MPPLLKALTEGPDIPLNKPILLIGRHEECDVLIPSRKISRRHCCIAQVNDYVVVKDLFSTNGVRINGVRVAEGPLKSGDELTIGNFRYKIQMNGMDAAENDGFGRNGDARAGREDRLESCEVPMALDDQPGDSPAPQGLPLVLPVEGAQKPFGDGNPYDKVQRGANSNSGEIRFPALR